MVEQAATAIGLRAPVRGVVVPVGLADGDAPRMRDGIADVVASCRVVVRARIYRCDNILCVRSVVWLDSSRARRVRGSEDGRRECEGVQIGPLSWQL